MCGAERAYGNWEGTETQDWEMDAYLMAEKARVLRRETEQLHY